AFQINLSDIRPLQVVHATQKRALTRSTRSNDAHYVAAVHIERHAAQYLERPKALVDLSNTDAWNCTHDPVDATPYTSQLAIEYGSVQSTLRKRMNQPPAELDVPVAEVVTPPLI